MSRSLSVQQLYVRTAAVTTGLFMGTIGLGAYGVSTGAIFKDSASVNQQGTKMSPQSPQDDSSGGGSGDLNQTGPVDKTGHSAATPKGADDKTCADRSAQMNKQGSFDHPVLDADMPPGFGDPTAQGSSAAAGSGTAVDGQSMQFSYGDGGRTMKTVAKDGSTQTWALVDNGQSSHPATASGDGSSRTQHQRTHRGEYFIIVQPTDTLSGISARTGVSVQRLAEVNHIKNVDLIYDGQAITIPAA